MVATVQEHVLPLARNRFRTERGLRESLSVLDDLWRTAADGLAPDGVHGRQTAAMLAHARWMYASALSRRESRGLQIRDDAPYTDPACTHRIRSGGLDEVWTAPEEVRTA
ncbi:hypothetical protein L2C96_24285 [Amycolatopsis tucumanensis]|nr:hypothetical protein [Amycolatopsis tucumanensis]